MGGYCQSVRSSTSVQMPHAQFELHEETLVIHSQHLVNPPNERSLTVYLYYAVQPAHGPWDLIVRSTRWLRAEHSTFAHWPGKVTTH